jgi:hypothetical protein
VVSCSVLCKRNSSQKLQRLVLFCYLRNSTGTRAGNLPWRP